MTKEDQLFEQLYLDAGGVAHPVFREELAAIVQLEPEITLRTDRKTKGGKPLKDGIEVRFGDTKPTDETRDLLKAHGFRWSSKQKMWYAIATEKAKEILPQIREGVMVDDDPGVVKHFWKKVGNIKELDRLTNYTEFMWGGRFFRTKKQLYRNLNSGEISKAIKDGELLWKKFYTDKSEKVNSEEAETENQQEVPSDEEETLRLRAQALALKLKLQTQQNDV